MLLHARELGRRGLRVHRRYLHVGRRPRGKLVRGDSMRAMTLAIVFIVVPGCGSDSPGAPVDAAPIDAAFSQEAAAEGAAPAADVSGEHQADPSIDALSDAMEAGVDSSSLDATEADSAFACGGVVCGAGQVCVHPCCGGSAPPVRGAPGRSSMSERLEGRSGLPSDASARLSGACLHAGACILPHPVRRLLERRVLWMPRQSVQLGCLRDFQWTGRHVRVRMNRRAVFAILGSALFSGRLAVLFAVPSIACGGAAASAADTGAADTAAGDAVWADRLPLEQSDVATDAAGDAQEAIDSGGVDDGSSASCVPPRRDGGACNELAPQGPPVVPTCSTAGVPAAQGGAIQDGTYVLETTTLSGAACSKVTARITWVICGSGWSTVQDISGSAGGAEAGAPVLHLTASVSVQGASLALDVTCSSDQGPLPAPRTWGYTASAGQLTLLIPQPGGGLRVDAFRLR
jgi:hypothetical protein